MRKVLSFVLVLSLVLGSFSMAFAATPASTGLSDIAGNANEEAIQVVNDLGIVTGNPDGTFLPEKAVNRAEFAAMITRALAIPESALAGYTATTFKDTAGYGWAVPYLAFCQSKGIMLGDGNGNAMPGRTINMNEAVTMALRAIGYTANSAQLVGAWPANYVTIAQNEGLYDDVAKVVNVDKANAAQIIYNLLTVQKVAVNADGETVALWTDKDKETAATLLNTGLGATASDAAVIFGDEDSSINLTKYIGAKAVAYVKDKKIVAIGEVDTTFLTGEFNTKGEFEATNGTDYTLKDVTVNTTGVALFVNGDFDAYGKTQDAVDNDPELLTLSVETSGKRITDIVAALEWNVSNAVVVEEDDLEAIDDNELLGFEFTEDDDDAIDYNSFELIGVNSLKDIKKDNVVYVYAANGEINRVAVGTKIVEGKVTKISGSSYTVDGAVYKFANVDGGVADADKPDAGDEVKLFIDAYGKIFDCELVEGTPDTYAFVLGASDSSVDGDRVRLHSSDNTKKTFSVDVDDFSASIQFGLIGYSLDKDGVVDSMVVASTGALNELNLRNVKIASVTYPIASDVPVFVLKSGAKEVDKITTYAKIDRDVLPTNVLYIVDDGKVVALAAEGFKGGSSDDAYGVFSKYSVVYDADQDDNVAELVGFVDGASATKLGDAKYDSMKNGVKAVGLYLVELDADGYIVEITPVADADSDHDVFTGVIDSLANSKNTITLKAGAGTKDLADKAVVYEVTFKASGDVDKYTVRSASALREDYKVYLYDTDLDEAGIEVVIFHK